MYRSLARQPDLRVVLVMGLLVGLSLLLLSACGSKDSAKGGAGQGNKKSEGGGTASTSVPAHATNGRIAYALDKESGAQIYTIKSDGTGQRQLTHVDGDIVSLDWSPNGREIVFELDHPNDHCSVEVMNADGTHMRDLTGTGHECDSSPAFMPGGDRVVFTAEGGSGPIMSMNLRGGDRRVIYRSQLYKKEPQVSPDGKRVLFLVEKDLPDRQGFDENEKALYSVRMNGTDLKTVVPFDFDVCACGGDWAPNGERIAFSNNAGAADEPQTLPNNLATIRPDGTDLRFLTHFQDIKVHRFIGSYSPDGRWILFKTASDDKYKLWKIHPDGTHKKLIATFKFNPFARDWGPRPT
jgi:Tol biopolymer transport system component